MADNTTTRILGALVERGLLKDEKKIEEINDQVEKGVDLRQAVVETDLVDDESYTKVAAEVLGFPYIDVREKTIPREVLTIIPESMARGHMIVAYEQTPSVLRVAMADPTDRQIVEFIRKKVDLPVEVAMSSLSAMRDVLGVYQQSLEVEMSNVLSEDLSKVDFSDEDLSKVADELPVISVTQAILKHAILEGASDIHMEPTEKKVVVRYRVDGMLRDVLVLPKSILPGLVARIKVLAKLKIDEHRLPQDGRFKLESDEYKVAFRVSTLPVFDGEKIVMRLLDESGKGLGLDEIGIRGFALKVFRSNVNKPHGMVLVTGPTGSGKTTTLYAAMKEMNKPDVNISTIEDPIEYRMPRINQTQVHPRIGLTFANGLRALVRQDPDIIMVGEIRDEETAALAVNAALTGHLVLSTLHTNSAVGALPRLRDMKVESFLLASTINLILAQRLVRRLCEHCRKEWRIDKETLEGLASEFDMERILSVLKANEVVKKDEDWGDIVFYKSEGCKRCREGYKGRVGIYEVLEITPEIQKMITPKVTSSELEEVVRNDQQMVFMIEDGFIKMVEGITSLEEVLRVARD